MQAGVNYISLYENRSVSFQYHDPDDLNIVSALTTGGETITVENNQRIDFDFDIITGNNYKILFDYIIKFYVFDLTIDSIEQIQTLKESIYGWLPLITFYDGTTKFYNIPLFCPGDSPIKVQDSMAFEVTLQNRVPTCIRHLNYATVADLGIKADTTLITADSTLYTADYAL